MLFSLKQEAPTYRGGSTFTKYISLIVEIVVIGIILINVTWEKEAVKGFISGIVLTLFAVRRWKEYHGREEK